MNPCLECELPASVPRDIPSLRFRGLELQCSPPSLEEISVLYQGYLGKAADFPPEDVYSEVEVFIRLLCEGLEGSMQSDGLIQQESFFAPFDAVPHYYV